LSLRPWAAWPLSPAGVHGLRPRPEPTTSPFAVARVLANSCGCLDLREDGAFNPALVAEIALA